MGFCLSRWSLPVILVSSEFIKVSIIDTFLVFVRKLMFLKYSCQKPLKKNCGRPVFLEELQTARNFSKVSMHFNKIPNYLTLSGLCFFENLKKKLGLGGDLVGPRWKSMLYLRQFLSILHEILYIYCIDNMEQLLIRRLTNVIFVIIWWLHHESHVLTFFKFFRNWWNTKILNGSAKYTQNRWPKIILKN